MRDVILSILRRRNGTKKSELQLAVMSAVNPQRYDSDMFDSVIRNLAEDGEIRTFIYSNPENPNLVKSMYFLKGTCFFGFVGDRINDSGKDSMARTSEGNT